MQSLVLLKPCSFYAIPLHKLPFAEMSIPLHAITILPILFHGTTLLLLLLIQTSRGAFRIVFLTRSQFLPSRPEVRLARGRSPAHFHGPAGPAAKCSGLATWPRRHTPSRQPSRMVSPIIVWRHRRSARRMSLGRAVSCRHLGGSMEALWGRPSNATSLIPRIIRPCVVCRRLGSSRKRGIVCCCCALHPGRRMDSGRIGRAGAAGTWGRAGRRERGMAGRVAPRGRFSLNGMPTEHIRERHPGRPSQAAQGGELPVRGKHGCGICSGRRYPQPRGRRRAGSRLLHTIWAHLLRLRGFRRRTHVATRRPAY